MKIFDSFNGGSVEQQKKKKILILSIIITVAVVAVIAISLTIALIFSSKDSETTTDYPDGTIPLVASYKEPEPADIIPGTGTLILVNKENTFDFEANPDSTRVKIADSIPVKKNTTTPLYTLKNSEMTANSAALAQFNKMVEDFYKNNPNAEKLYINTAYRSKADQDSIGSKIKGGQSDFHTGLSFELKYENGSEMTEINSSKNFDWIYQNAHRYGFIVRYPAGHEGEGHAGDETVYKNLTHFFRYVGVAHATYIKENNICLEEYLDRIAAEFSLAADDTAPKAARILKIKGADNASYEVYYCPKDIAVLVPPRGNYEISADNKGGYIVTVKK